MDGDHLDSLVMREKVNSLKITIHQNKYPTILQYHGSLLNKKLLFLSKIDRLPSRLIIQVKQADSYSRSLPSSFVWVDCKSEKFEPRPLPWFMSPDFKMRVKLSAKLLIIAWTLMKKKEPFHPDYLAIE
jgi:hypothetical protein